MRNRVLSLLAIFVVVACSSDASEMIGDAMVDAGQMLRDSGAHAQCDTCSISEPVRVSSIDDPVKVDGRVHVITAQTDPDQLVGGPIASASVTDWAQLASGPLVVTGLMTMSGGLLGIHRLAIADTGNCGTERVQFFESGGSLVGMHVLVGDGKDLCGAASAYWSGFRPYE